jgi:heat shock protein HtpX
MAAYGLYSHIQANRRRSIALLIALFLLVYVLVFAGALVGEALTINADLDILVQRAWRDLIGAAPLATVGTALWIVIAYFFHQSMIDAVTGARDVGRQEQPRLYNLLENLCISRGITMPKLKIMDTDALNAFATGMNQKQYSITVTSGLLSRLNDAEIEAVLGHELTHIRNGDVRMMVVAVIIAGAVSFIAELVFRLWFWNGFSFRSSRSDDRRGGGAGLAILIAIGLLVLAYVLSFFIRLALSRSREFLADAGSVELTKKPDAMISALRKIEGRGELPGATSAVMEMCVDNPRRGFGELFDTHPSVESRVAALVRYAGGHDPGPISLPSLADQTDDGARDSAPPGPWSEPQRGGPDGGAQNGPEGGPWGPTTGAPSDGASGMQSGAPPESPPGPWGPRNAR